MVGALSGAFQFEAACEVELYAVELIVVVELKLSISSSGSIVRFDLRIVQIWVFKHSY